jgi:bacterioferritin-associated ferredoxin
MDKSLELEIEIDDEIICDCSGTTRKKIESLIAQGIDTLDGISRKTGAVSGCGACDWDISALLKEHEK